MSMTTIAGSRTTSTMAASTPSSPSVWTYQLTCACATMWATRGWDCPTSWTTRPCQRSSSKRAAGCPSWPNDAMLTPRSSSARCLHRSAWTGPSIPAAHCVRPWGTAVLQWWRPTASPGQRCWPVISFPLITTSASPCSSQGTMQPSHQVWQLCAHTLTAAHTLSQAYTHKSIYCMYTYMYNLYVYIQQLVWL